MTNTDPINHNIVGLRGRPNPGLAADMTFAEQFAATIDKLNQLGTELTEAEKQSVAIAQAITDGLALEEAVAVPLAEVRCLWDGDSDQRTDRNCMCADCIALTAEQNRNAEAVLKEQRTAKAVLIVLPDGTNGFQCSMCDQRVFASRPHSCFGEAPEASSALRARVAEREKEARAEREAQQLLLVADRSRPPRWDPLGVAPTLWFLPEPGPAPAPRKRRSERVRDILLAGFNGLIALIWEVGKSGRQALGTFAVLSGKVLSFPFVLLVRVLKAITRFMTLPWPAMFASWLGIAVGVVDVVTGNYLIAGILFVVSTFFFVAVMFRQPKKKPAVEHTTSCTRCQLRMEGPGAVCATCKQEVRERARAELPNKGEGWTFTKEGWVSPTPRCSCVPGTSKLCATCRDRQDVVSRTSGASLETASLSPCSSCGDPAVGWVCMRCEAIVQKLIR